MAKKRTASSQGEELVQVSDSAMRKPLTKKQERELKDLAARPDSEIDFSDIPETVGTFYKPMKRPVTIRLDADVLAWLKSRPGYQTRVNQFLRDAMNSGRR